MDAKNEVAIAAMVSKKRLGRGAKTRKTGVVSPDLPPDLPESVNDIEEGLEALIISILLQQLSTRFLISDECIDVSSVWKLENHNSDA